MTIPRCTHCHHFIWPWQHIGWRVQANSTLYWHAFEAVPALVKVPVREPLGIE